GGTSATAGQPRRETRNRSPRCTRSINSAKRRFASAAPRFSTAAPPSEISVHRPDVMMTFAVVDSRPSHNSAAAEACGRYGRRRDAAEVPDVNAELAIAVAARYRALNGEHRMSAEDDEYVSSWYVSVEEL